VKKSNRDKVVRMVDFIITKMPEPIWISELRLEAKAGTAVDLKGFSTTYQTISTYFTRLEDAVFFTDWQLVETSLQKVKGPTGEDIDASKFDLKAQVTEVP
jgi:Tfp pilus assembly protein PilN